MLQSVVALQKFRNFMNKAAEKLIKTCAILAKNKELKMFRLKAALKRRQANSCHPQTLQKFLVSSALAFMTLL